MQAYARFDDLRQNRAFELRNPFQIKQALGPDDVLAVVAWAESEVGRGRWVAGYVAYEAAPAFDSAMVCQAPISGLPLAWFASFANRGRAADPGSGTYRIGEWTSDEGPEEHHKAVDAIRKRIRLGDTYQVNHTFRLRSLFEGDPIGLYRDLTRSQTCGYGAYLDTGRWAVVSASPELFFEWEHRRIRSRPMKGTIERGRTLADDEANRRWLEKSEKNRAENLMIVDMVRNDIGRVAVTGTVEVPELFATEKYDTLWQLTSTVEATTRHDVALPKVFEALFPCASITGAPKIATMEIIAQLEAQPRGVYCGAIGFGGPGRRGTPQWAFNVAIRTALIDRDHGIATYGTGGGVTFDSSPEGEYREAILKAAVLQRRSADFELLETMRCDPDTGIARRPLHLDRLMDSAAYFDIPVELSGIESALDTLIGPCLVRLLVGRTGAFRVECSDLPAPSRPTLAVDDRPVDSRDVFLAHKTTRRDRYEEAAERFPKADDVVLWNAAGNVTETTIANLAVLMNGTWLTPPVADGCLPGVMRRELLESGRISEAAITLADLRSADVIARFNSVRGWEPAHLAD